MTRAAVGVKVANPKQRSTSMFAIHERKEPSADLARIYILPSRKESPSRAHYVNDSSISAFAHITKNHRGVLTLTSDLEHSDVHVNLWPPSHPCHFRSQEAMLEEIKCNRQFLRKPNAQ